MADYKSSRRRVVESRLHERTNQQICFVCLWLHSFVLLLTFLKILTQPWSSTKFDPLELLALNCRQPTCVSSTCQHNPVHQDLELSSKYPRMQPWRQLCEKENCEKPNLHMRHSCFSNQNSRIVEVVFVVAKRIVQAYRANFKPKKTEGNDEHSDTVCEQAAAVSH